MAAPAWFRKPTRISLLAVFLSLTACGSETPLEPIDTSLIGTWRMVGLRAGETTFNPSGTWVFFEDGLMAMDLTFTYDDAPTSKFAATGQFTRTGNSVTFMIRGNSSTWDMVFSAQGVVLTQTGPAPADDVITLDRL